jgi:lauroyl/myristoyl acyltransferase
VDLKAAGTVLAYRGGWRAVRYLPDAAAYRLFDQVADTAWRRQTKGAVRLRANLVRAAPSVDGGQLDQLTRAALRSYFWYWADAFRLPDWSPHRVNRIDVRNFDVLAQARAAGRGAVGALPHMGNWDHAAAWVMSAGVPVTTVAERLKPDAVYQRFVDFRQGLGMTIYPLTGGEDVFARLASHVRDNDFVPLVADRDLTARGVGARLLGERASMPAGPAALALRTGAPLIPVSTWFSGQAPDHTLVLQFDEPIIPPASGGRDAVATMTQALADVFSRRIRDNPRDWHMLQRLFTADLDRR